MDTHHWLAETAESGEISPLGAQRLTRQSIGDVIQMRLLRLSNIAVCLMLYREFSGEETPLDKFAILGKVAELPIPD
jgi:hypothetical protein